jgi:hypothetical protein
MLDLDHPMTQFVFQASGLMDSVMKRGQRMSVSPSDVRRTLRDECLPHFAAMKELAQTRFSEEAPFILAAVDEYEAAIRDLADLGGGAITEDRRSGKGPCPVCGGKITHLKAYGIVCCGTCDGPMMRAYEKLDAPEGFGTCDI